MEDHKLRRKNLAKRATYSAIVTSILLISILGIAIRFLWITPRVTTNFFHFNIDYRLGRAEIEDSIIKEPYYKLLKMYERHPNWDFTIELQAAMIEMIYNRTEYKEIAALTTKLVNLGQMELICALEYSQLYYAYPADVFELNLKYANQTLDKYGLLAKRSNAILFQEGQYAYGLGTLLNSAYASNIDTVLISAQQILSYQRKDYLKGSYPVYELNNPETGKSIKLLQYNLLPQWEADFLHSWTFMFDGEIVAETDTDDDIEFTVDDNKMRAFEGQLLMLEQEGNQFMTLSDWVQHCVDVGAVGKLDYYIPESNWNSVDYNSSELWMANNKGSTDDGELISNNYRFRQILSATRQIYEQNKALLVNNKTIIDAKFEMAEKLWLQATCTDSTGLNPRHYERITAERNILIAEQNCSQILQIIADEVPNLNVSQIQVDLKTGMIYNNSNTFLNLITVLDNTLSLTDLPLDITMSGIKSDQLYAPNFNVSKIQYNSSDFDNEIFNLTRLDVTFNGTHNWEDGSIQKISIMIKKLSGYSVKEIIYSPSLLENETKRIWRYNYKYDPVFLFLPLSNGLIFIPDDYTGFRGTAIVKNVTQRHTTWLWEYYYLEILEKNGVHLDARQQLFFMEDVTLDRALKFANRINVAPPWIVSKNVSLIQGNEVYNTYLQMANKNPDNFTGKWW
jgi:hypothetical protein